jgi:FkbM family methyltransferase
MLQSRWKRHQMIRERLIDTAMRLGVDEPLRSMRARLLPQYREQRTGKQQLRALLEATLTPTSNCIDIGAFRGRVLAEMLRVAPRGRHIAYEPLPHMYRYLARRFPSVDLRQAAVSNADGETTFTFVKHAPGKSGFRGRAHAETEIERLTVRTETLDTHLPAGYKPDLIKVDVEGAERLIFEGAIKTISTARPVILFEHGKGGADHYETQPTDIYALLHEQAGLRIFDMDGNGPYSLAQFEDAYAQNTRWDFLARP